jgi:hypothetical protein
VEKLFDVSAVDLPASEHTDISARSYADSIIEARNKMVEEKAAAEAEEKRNAEEAERKAAEKRKADARRRRARAMQLSTI